MIREFFNNPVTKDILGGIFLLFPIEVLNLAGIIKKMFIRMAVCPELFQLFGCPGQVLVMNILPDNIGTGGYAQRMVRKLLNKMFAFYAISLSLRYYIPYRHVIFVILHAV